MEPTAILCADDGLYHLVRSASDGTLEMTAQGWATKEAAEAAR